MKMGIRLFDQGAYEHNGSPSKKPDIKTPLVVTTRRNKLTTSGTLLSGFFEGLPLQTLAPKIHVTKYWYL